MRLAIKLLQKSKVNEIVELFNDDSKTEITFKSPTGSGKTYMMADFMNSVMKPNIVFIVSSLSKGQLAEQNHEKFVSYSFNDFKNFNPYLINSETAVEEKLYIPVDYNVYSLPRDLYKKNSKLMEGSMIAFLDELIRLNKKIVLIKDECHQATNNLDLLNPYFYKVINTSATPPTNKFVIDVELTEEEAVTEKLIKINQNPLDNSPIGLGNQLEILEREAIPLFLSVKKEYNEKLKMNPCMIIQISNKTKGEKEWKAIKKIIDKPEYGLKWMYIAQEGDKENDTNDDVKKLPMNKWRDYAKNNEALIDIIVFKMVISEGWDIPRACMLYQIRDTESTVLDQQVYGRIRRNPILLNWSRHDKETQNLALKCWVWGLLEKDKRIFKKVNLKPDVNIQVQTTKLTNLSKDDSFDMEKYLMSRKKDIITSNIFELYRNWNKISDETRKLTWQHINEYKDWFVVSNNIVEIDKKNNEYLGNYAKSMVVADLVNFSKESYYEKTGQYVEIDNWVWENADGENEYHFDSLAEKEFAKILRATNNNLYGKNYYPNSDISFEYFDQIVKKSYPDFILKSRDEKIHIFEVKSLEKSSSFNINSDEYKEKINNIALSYLYASKNTNHVFYIPIMVNKKWVILNFNNGVEKTMTLDELKEVLKYE